MRPGVGKIRGLEVSQWRFQKRRRLRGWRIRAVLLGPRRTLSIIGVSVSRSDFIPWHIMNSVGSE